MDVTPKHPLCRNRGGEAYISHGMTTVEVVEPHERVAEADTQQIQGSEVHSTVIPIGRPLEEQLQSQQHMSQCPRPRFFLTKLDLDRNVSDLVPGDPSDHFSTVRTVKEPH